MKTEKKYPSRWGQKLLSWFCDDNLVEAIEGDLFEAFFFDLAQFGWRKANRIYLISVLKFIKPQFMQKFKASQDFTPQLSNYLKMTVRNFKKHSLVAGVNLFGFTLGLAVMIFVALYLKNELSADKQIPQAELVNRIIWNYRSQTYSNLPFIGWTDSDQNAQKAYLNAFAEIPEIDNIAQFVISNTAIMGREYFIEGNGKRIANDKILFTNTPEPLQEIFNWSLLAGKFQPNDLNGAILTKSIAISLFGNDKYLASIGDFVVVNNQTLVIRAIIEDIPDNSHLDFSMVAAVNQIPNSWGAYTYTKLVEGSSIDLVAEKITEAYYTIQPNKRDDPLEKGMLLQPILDIHIGSNHLYELENNTNPVYLLIFGVIGLLILVITCTNYLNLSIALYSHRLKEIGIRKVIGAHRSDIRRQFLFEALFNSLVALPLAILSVNLGLPYFNQMMVVSLEMSTVLSPDFLVYTVFLTLTVGLLSGLYPSIFLSSKSVLALMKNKLSIKNNSVFSIRRVLIGVQFFLLVLLCGFGFFIQKQMQFIKTKDLGFNPEGVVYFTLSDAEQFKLARTELLKNPNIIAVGNGGVPGNNQFNQMTFSYDSVDEVFDDGYQIYMDVAMAEALGIKSADFGLLNDGRNSIVLLNETAAARYEKLTGESRSELIGKQFIEAPSSQNENGTMGYPVNIDGFISDFNFFSLRETNNPFMVTVFKEMPWVYDVVVKLKTDDLFSTIDEIEQVYYQYESELPFQLGFLEERLEKLYANENRIANIVVLLAVLSIVLAYLGLMGITYYAAKARQKELAIRKVLGADVLRILIVMSKEFLITALVATVIAIPLTIFAANIWLEGFAFKIKPEPFSLIIIGLAAIVIMLSGVISQSSRTANANPISSLRTEG
jgi:putative ABC transport system permease protein